MAGACRAWRALGSRRASPCLWSSLDPRALDSPMRPGGGVGLGVVARLAVRAARRGVSGCAGTRRPPPLPASAPGDSARWWPMAAAPSRTPRLPFSPHGTRSFRVSRSDPTLWSASPATPSATSRSVARVFAACASRDSVKLMQMLLERSPATAPSSRTLLSLIVVLLMSQPSPASSHSGSFLSVSGCRNLKWATASAFWAQLPSLLAIDVSRTDVSPSAVSRLISHSKTLKVICTLNCSSVEDEQAHNPAAFSNSKGKLVFDHHK
ncbi:hypothetical protein PR202_ga07849 [Eleusine coracana subsp. coracana]|uniref:Uncharacterized protein n=1 Tax=Eleusine coracana subsp. coracana TaxID=191504 RepID=A0AAV5C0A8_ELECO|nr:hypothetical protein PR202_ga07849 [Eleusine coracana subsp. coracana]